MQTPNWNTNQFLDSAALNAAAAATSGSISQVVAGAMTPGFLHPETVTVTPSGLTALVTAGAGFGVVTSTGVMAVASGTTTGAFSSSYSVNFTALKPVGAGTTTAYLICTPSTIQENPTQIIGPPPGHPDWNPNFQAYTGYMMSLDSLAITADTVPPNGVTSFALAQCTLGSGTTNLSFTYNNQTRAGLITTTAVATVTGSLAFGIADSGRVTNATASANITLPVLSLYNGVPYTVTSATTGTVLLNSQGSDLIYGTVSSSGSGVTSVPVPPGATISLLGEPNGWYIMGGSADALGSPRTRATQNFTLYVAVNGSDLNNGKSVSTPFATLNKAWSTLQKNTDLNGFTCTIQLADGTYSGNNHLDAGGRITGQVGPVILNGNSGARGNVIISDTSGSGSSFCAAAWDYAYIRVQNLKMAAPGSNGICINAYYNGHIDLQNVEFGATNFCHIAANLSGTVIATGPYFISGSTGNHLEAVNNSVINVAGQSITLSGNPNFSGAFTVALLCGTINIGGVTFSGSASGAQYQVSLNGVVWTAGGLAGNSNYLPGSSGGNFAVTGGQIGT